MSKMDGLRAMREARYAQQAAAPKQAKPRPQPTPAPPDKKPAPIPSADDTLCGHRAISGRTCTREARHAAKSHRYS